MAMGIVSDEDFKKDLENVGRKPTLPIQISGQVIEKKERGWNGGKNPGDSDIPDVLKRVIGTAAIESGNRKEIAGIFGVSESTVSATKNGANSTATYHQPDKDLKAFMRSRRVEVQDRAREKLFSALDGITQEKLDATKARDLAGIAKDMSAVIKNMDESTNPDSVHQTSIVFYSPRMKSEDEYAVIDVSKQDD